MNKEFNGKLEIKHDRYILQNGDYEYDLSDICKKSYVYIEINSNDNEDIYLGDYKVFYETPDGYKIASWSLQDEDIDKFLFNHIGEYMSVTIKAERLESDK